LVPSIRARTAATRRVSGVDGVTDTFDEARTTKEPAAGVIDTGFGITA
jgi:hypothetical protein